MSAKLEKPDATASLREQVMARLGPDAEPETAARVLTLAGWVQEGAQDTGGREMPLTDLCAHIIRQHHGYLRDALPRLASLSAGAATAHPDLRLLADMFAGFRMDLETHMAKEESSCFPQMTRLEKAGQEECDPEDGTLRPSVSGPINFLEAEHEEALATLEAMRRVTSGYTPPEGAGASVRLLMAELAILAEDMHWHVHKEDAILFPRAVALERAQTPEVW